MVDLRVVDENMADVPHDGKATGEIVVRAPWLTTGYLNNPEASEVLWGGGYLHTGDVASIDPDGYLRIADRLKDIVKSGGEWISSISLENIIMEKPGVQRAAVIPMKDVKWGERPHALVVLHPDHAGKVGEDDIRLHVASYVERGIISKIAIPENVTFVAGAAADLGRQGRQEDAARQAPVIFGRGYSAGATWGVEAACASAFFSRWARNVSGSQ